MRINRDGYKVPHIHELKEIYKKCKHYKVVKAIKPSDRRTFCVKCMIRLKHKPGRMTYTIAVREEGFWDVTVPWLLHSNKGRVIINR